MSKEKINRYEKRNVKRYAIKSVKCACSKKYKTNELHMNRTRYQKIEILLAGYIHPNTFRQLRGKMIQLCMQMTGS